MRRYLGEELPPGSRIAVIANDALGNYVASTPLLRMLREKHRPSALHYFSGTRTEELWMADPKIDWGYSLHGSSPHHAVLHTFVENESRPYDLVVNLENNPWAKCFVAVVSGLETFACGPALGEDGRKDFPFGDDPRGRLWADKEWIAEDLLEKYAFLESGFIGEIFCRLAFLSGPIPPYDVPRTSTDQQVTDVVIATAASSDDKLWPATHWMELLRRLKAKQLSVSLVGAKPTAQSAFWKGAWAEDAIIEKRLALDLRGKLRLPEVGDLLGKARLVVTLDNGILHLAVANQATVIGLYRHGIHRLWAPPHNRLSVIVPSPGEPVEAITVDEVWENVERAL